MIEGNNFVGPFDKGYNKVHFGPVSATFVPVSKNKLWATVPDMSPGNVKISVTTQNGTSNAVDFNVEKPSWKFW